MTFLAYLCTCYISEHWVFGANDNDWVGWGMTVAYFAAAALCFICGRRACGPRHEAGGRERLLGYRLYRSDGLLDAQAVF